MPIKPLEKRNDNWVEITIEMNLNRVDYQRFRYTALDLLAAFGGFMGIFRWIFGTFMAAWNFQALDNFMISHLYKASTGKKASFSSEEALERSRCPHLGAYLLSWVPSFLVCCSKRGKEKTRAKARAQLSKEMNMVELLRSQRYFSMAMNLLLSKR